MFKLALAGFGAIGQELARMLLDDPRLRLTQILVPPGAEERISLCAARLAPQARVLTRLDCSPGQRPDLLAECAGHAAVMAHVVPALAAGIPCAVASVGALHEADHLGRLEAAARAGGTRVQLIAGAIGGIDALAAARMGGLDEVTYVGTKPPLSWLGTPAEKICALAELTAPRVVFQGTAREAAVAFPKNANVAATVALAGLGLDRTRVELVADPGVARNVHRVRASGSFGRLELMLENLSLPDNPKTSALAAYSLARAVRNASATVFF